ncbi:hypothetical protein [Flavobacterium aquidurense]|uniref:Uncharacterized protein n=1 Tax=Flavobacterium aquidurense TaxID=362413 RepID=A0A0Q0RPR0_9FLAO|nr:hypothetical protein [Flavobacterium aquidurense]KQB38373.1 hypothetical protein RC62_1728 [Flavobacterium aquidurense]
MFDNFNDFTNYSTFTKDDDLGQYTSYAAYNRDLLRVVDFYGRTPFDWYRNKITGQIIWLDGKAEINHYSNLGHIWGKTFPNNDRILLDGNTKKIYFNNEVIYDFSPKKSFFSTLGIAFSDGSNSQNPGALPRGGRNVTWIDFGGLLEALTTIFAFEVRGNKPKGKGTNGGKPTQEDKVDDFINANDFGANGIKAVKETLDKQKAKENNANSTKSNKNIRTTWYDKSGKEIRTEVKIHDDKKK